jgi:hypothetical protein
MAFPPIPKEYEMGEPVVRVKSWLLLTVVGVVVALASQGFLLWTHTVRWQLNAVAPIGRVLLTEALFGLVTLVGVLVAVYGVFVGATDHMLKQATHSIADLKLEVAALRSDLASYSSAVTSRLAGVLAAPDSSLSPPS